MKRNLSMNTSPSQGGSSLIMILCLIALITTAAVAFSAGPPMPAPGERPRTRSGVRQICESGADHALSSLLSWITSNSDPLSDGSGTTWYFPGNACLMPPPRFLAQGSIAGDTNFDNLRLQSVSAWDASASADSTGLPSGNGRLVSPESWSAPALLPSGFASTDQLPRWIYFNRDGSLSSSPSTNTVGRFAYNAYDLGGLLDANVAGYPSSVPAADRRILKGTLAGADLTMLPGVTGAAVDSLVSFRNPGTTGSNYASMVAASARAGFLSPVTSGSSSGNITNAFFATRQDLIRYARNRNTPLTNALPLLTHFSRELARPSVTRNGLLAMTSRYDLSRVSNPAGTGLTGGRPLFLRRQPLAGHYLCHPGSLPGPEGGHQADEFPGKRTDPPTSSRRFHGLPTRT